MRDFIVVGSGAGGATMARELSSAGRSVLLLEGGKEVPPAKAASAYSVIKGDVEIWYAQCLGGTTNVSMGNAVRSSQYRTLKEHYAIAEVEMGVCPVPEGRMGRGTRLLLETYKGWRAMPKAIDFSICRGCGLCPNGCPHGARWSALTYLSEARRSGCEVLLGYAVRKVIIESGRAVGVELADGRSFMAGAVVLSAGAIETPRILQRSGVGGAGEGLFVDTFITVGGRMGGIGMNGELGMALYLKREGYLLSPHYSSYLVPRLREKGLDATPRDVLGVMVKVKDEPSGIVGQEKVLKGITRQDALRLEAGRREAINILTAAGVDADTIVSTHPRGAHPGGTCHPLVKSGEGPVPGIDGLYITDASILEGPFGIPPLLTIVALSKRLAASLLGRG